MCGFCARNEVRDGVLGHHERSARVDLVHQIEPLHVRVGRARELDRACIVHDDVDAAEAGCGLLDRTCDLRFLADVTGNRECFAASLLDLFGGRVNGALKLRVRLVSFRRDRNVCTVARGAERDRETDAARRAGDKEGLSLKRHQLASTPTASATFLNPSRCSKSANPCVIRRTTPGPS